MNDRFFDFGVFRGLLSYVFYQRFRSFLVQARGYSCLIAIYRRNLRRLIRYNGQGNKDCLVSSNMFIFSTQGQFIVRRVASVFVRMLFVLTFIALIVDEFRLTRVFNANAIMFHFHGTRLTNTFYFTRRDNCSVFCNVFLTSGSANRNVFNFNGGRVVIVDNNVCVEEVNNLCRFIRAHVRRVISRHNYVVLCRVTRITFLLIEDNFILIRSRNLCVKLFLILVGRCGELLIIICQVMLTFNDVKLNKGVEGRFLSLNFSNIRVCVTGCRGALGIQAMPLFVMISRDLQFRIRGSLRHSSERADNVLHSFRRS